ncbi:hypothetical protein MRX96_036470 [Rhipicephalus microplus]
MRGTFQNNSITPSNASERLRTFEENVATPKLTCQVNADTRCCEASAATTRLPLAQRKRRNPSRMQIPVGSPKTIENARRNHVTYSRLQQQMRPALATVDDYGLSAAFRGGLFRGGFRTTRGNGPRPLLAVRPQRPAFGTVCASTAGGYVESRQPARLSGGRG